LSEGSVPFPGEKAHNVSLPAGLEAFATILIAVAAILTAWGAFQHAKWSGTQANEFRQAAAAGTAATQATTIAGMNRTVDVVVFLQWLQAIRNDIDAGLADPSTGPYVADPATLSGFIAQRFRSEFLPAFDAWIATRPLTTIETTTPFELPEYSLAADSELARWSKDAEVHGTNAQHAIHNGEQYVLLTTLFAVALVLASIGSKLRHVTASAVMLSMAAVLILGAAVALLTLPAHL
jgi:hypothetical protein